MTPPILNFHSMTQTDTITKWKNTYNYYYYYYFYYSDNIYVYNSFFRDDPPLVHVGGRLPELLRQRAERRRHQQGGRHPGR